MLEDIQGELKECTFLDSKNKVLLAVSGGVDSVVLLDLMNKIPSSKKPQIAIAHVNHHLRNESNSEEKFVKELAQKYSFPFYSHQWLKKDHPNSGIEKAARNERYNFFKTIMDEYKISYLMTGHHLDDQIETILMRLIRGASLEQLLGIKFKQSFSIKEKEGYLIRPLLNYSKKEIYEYAKSHQLNYIEDQSNKNKEYTRNRFRNEVIPLLKAENAKFSDHIKQFRTDLRNLIQISQIPIDDAYRELIREEKKEIHLNLNNFQNYSSELQRAVINQILTELYKEKTEQYKTNYIKLIHTWLIEGEVNSSLDLTANYLVEKKYSKAIFKKKTLLTKTQKNICFKLNKVNQWINLSETEAIGLFTPDRKNEDFEGTVKDQLKIAIDDLNLPLTIRHRKPGDRMTHKGLDGRKKIKDIFIDDKIAKSDRDRTWLVEDNKGRIIWLISHRKMELFTDLETDKLFYNLKFIKK